jgi:hypothetical protein
MNYYHYRATLAPDAWTSYGRGGGARYIVERFSDAAVRRVDVVRRRVTLTGRFYDLCAAAERDRAQDEDEWVMLLGPCHYGHDQGLMLDDVSIDAIHDELPRYILGERNRVIFAELPRADGAERATLIERTRAWAALLQQGPSAVFAAHFTAHPTLASRPEEEQREIRESFEDADGYVAFASSRLARLNIHRAPVEVFWNHSYGERDDEAFGCICLTSSCADEWPLTSRDAEYFIGNAVCTELERQSDGTWRW